MEKIGLEAAFEIPAFRKGVEEYMTKIGWAETKTEKASSSMSAALGSFVSVASTAFTVAAAAVAAGIGAITAAAVGGINAVTGWAETIDGVGDVLGTSAQESAALAVAIQGVGGNVEGITGQMAFLTRGLVNAKGELGPTGQALADLGISFRDTNGQMLPATQILSNVADVVGNMPDGLEKTTVMMGIFGKSGKDLSDVMGALANGGLAAADQRARDLGLTLSEEAAAASIKLNQQFNLLKLAGQGLGVTLGNQLLPGVLKAVSGITEFVMIVVKATQEGGALYPIVQALGAVMSLVGDLIQGGAAKAAQGFVDFVSSAAGVLTGAADNAVTWGGNIITQLANGIIQGASSALAGAMEFVGNMLSYFLAPGSPPRVAPEVDKWGMSAMGEYLKGMTSADFGVLKSIQGPLNTALSAVMDSDKAKDALSGITKGLADALRDLQAGKAVDPKIFETIRKSAGEYGGELAKLARDQLEVAAATMQAEKAEKALSDAQNRQKAANTKVSALTREYNNLLRAGASPDVLKAKLAQINAAEKERDAADKDVKAKEDALSLAKKEQEAAKQKADAQAALVDQVLALIKAQKEAAKEGEKAGSGGGAVPKLPGGGISLPPINPGDLIKSIDKPLESLKQKITDKLAGVFGPIAAIWQQNIGPAIEKVSAAFEVLKQKLTPVFAFLKTAWIVITDVVLAFWDTIQPYLISFWEEAKEVFQDNFGPLMEAFRELWQSLQPVFAAVGAVLLAVVGIIAGVLTGALKAVAPAIEMIIKIVTGLVKVLTGVIKFITGFVKLFIGLITGNKKAVIDAFKEMGRGVELIVKGLVEALLGYIQGMTKTAQAFISGFVDGVLKFFGNLYNRLTGGSGAIVPKMINGIIDNIKKLPGEALEIFGKFVVIVITTITNALPKILQLGKDIITKIKEGITSTWSTVTAAFGALLSAWNLSIYGGILNKLVQIGRDIIAKIRDGLNAAWSTITGALGSLLQSLSLGSFGQAISNLLEFGADVISQIASGLRSAWYSVTGALGDLFGGLSLNSIASAIYALLRFGGDVIKQIASGFGSYWSNITGGLSDLFRGLNIGNIWSAVGKLMDFGTDVIKQIWEGMKSAWGSWIVANLNWVVSLLPQWFKDLLGIGGGGLMSRSLSISARIPAVAPAAPSRSLTPAAAVSNVNNANLNITNNLASGMDVAMLQRLIVQTVRTELG